MSTEAVVPGVDNAVDAGQVLARARQALGLDVAQAASRLHVPLHMVTALESGQWARLGAPVFIRGQLRSYARLLAIDPAPLIDQVPVEQIAPVALVSHHAATPRLRRIAGGLGRKSVYLGVAVLVALPALALMRHYLSPDVAVASLDALPVASGELPLPAVEAEPSQPFSAAVAEPVTPSGAPAVAAPDAVSTAPAPVPASPAAVAPAVSAGQLLLQFAGDSWIDIAGPKGEVVEKALVPAGQQRRYAMADVSRVVLGNSAQVQASIDGRAIELAPLRRSNVARFTVSSDGSVSPASN